MIIEKVTKAIEKTVAHLELELWGCEHVVQGRHSVLKIYLDKPGGVSMEECAAASRQISGILDVEDLIKGNYRLEVSSPGVERPLFQPKQYPAYIGKKIALKCQVAIAGRRNFKGVLTAVEDDYIILDVEGQQVNVDFANIDKAHLMVNFEDLYQ